MRFWPFKSRRERLEDEKRRLEEECKDIVLTIHHLEDKLKEEKMRWDSKVKSGNASPELEELHNSMHNSINQQIADLNALKREKMQRFIGIESQLTHLRLEEDIERYKKGTER